MKDRILWTGRIAGVLCFAAGFVIPALGRAPDIPVRFAYWTAPALFIAAWFLVGGDVLFRALGNIRRGHVFDENFLMTIATIGAFAIGEYGEGAAVMIFFQTGEFFQDLALRRSRKSITALMDLRPDSAMVRREGPPDSQGISDSRGTLVRLSPEEVRPGDIIEVRPGEKIPLDAVVLEGDSLVDTAALTGESLPRRAQAGSEVLAGTLNQTALLVLRVTREAGDSAAARILRLVQEAEEKKAPAEQFITRFARYYTPAVVLAAAALALIPPLVITAFGAGASGGGAFGAASPGGIADFFPLFVEWLRRALVFLVVSCPCALVVSIPLSFFGGIGGASRRGILVKGGSYLDALTRAGAVVFDKTGTLTRGVFTLSRIIPAAGFSEEDLLRAAALAESNSNHPIALSIRKAAADRGLGMETGAVRSFSENAGKGARLQLEDGRSYAAGSRTLLEESGIAVPADDAPRGVTSGTVVYAAVDGVYAGRLVAADELKPDSAAAVAALKKAGLRTVMLSGDSPEAAAAAAAEAGIDEAYGGLLPWEKVEIVERLKGEIRAADTRRNRVIFVGDGINDAPVLASSDIGAAMGALGSDAAIESADMVLMTDEPSRLVDALGIAAKTIAIVKQNIVFALGVKAALLALGAAGIASLWMAVFGDVGVALIAVLNACRAMDIRPVGR